MADTPSTDVQVLWSVSFYNSDHTQLTIKFFATQLEARSYAEWHAIPRRDIACCKPGDSYEVKVH